MNSGAAVIFAASLVGRFTHFHSDHLELPPVNFLEQED
jgi:hypothetical protein